MTDIRNGINAGKTVTVHDTQISFNGWSGTGYTISDAGAYMIGGGLDGAFISDEASILLSLFGLAVGVFGTIGLVISTIIAIILAIDLYRDLQALPDCGSKEAISTFLNGLAVFSILASLTFAFFATPLIGAVVAVIMTYVSLFTALILINMVNPLSCRIRENEEGSLI